MLFRVSFLLLLKYFIRIFLNLRVQVVLSALRVYPFLHVQLKPMSPKTKLTLQDYPIEKEYEHIMETYPMSFIVSCSIMVLANIWSI